MRGRNQPLRKLRAGMHKHGRTQARDCAATGLLVQTASPSLEATLTHAYLSCVRGLGRHKDNAAHWAC